MMLSSGSPQGGPSAAVRAFLAGLVDFAPWDAGAPDPAEACAGYARALMSDRGWMVGRLVWPASMAEKLERAGGPLMPGTYATSGYREMADVASAWQIELACEFSPDGDAFEELHAAMDVADALNERHSSEDFGLARVVSLRVPALTPDFIDDAIEEIPNELGATFVLPTGVVRADARGYAIALAGDTVCAGVRLAELRDHAGPDAAASMMRLSEMCGSAAVPLRVMAVDAPADWVSIAAMLVLARAGSRERPAAASWERALGLVAGGAATKQLGAEHEQSVERSELLRLIGVSEEQRVVRARAEALASVCVSTARGLESAVDGLRF